MEEVGKILPAVFKRHVRRAEPPLVELLTPLWPRIVGKPMAQHSRPVTFAAGTLTLATACPSWAAQLRQMAAEIRAAINSFLGGPIVKKLRVRQALNLDLAPPSVPEPPNLPELGTKKPLGPGGAAELDPEIASIYERSFAKYFARKRRRVD